jgi:hypothetical protein
VPAGWQHPKDERGSYKPLYGRSWSEEAAEWDRENAEWNAGQRPTYWSDDGTPEARFFDQRHGPRPFSGDYMPDWPESERTHWQMYEDTSEGTPISPVMESPEALARWLADNGASAFGQQTASYEAWLGMIERGSAPSMILSAEGVESGVSALHRIGS